MTSHQEVPPIASDILLVHGGWGGSWCWEEVERLLHDRGVESSAVDLASSGDDPAKLGDLHGDIDIVRQALDAIQRPVVLCGHSYGGVVITGAGEYPTVRHLVYIAAAMSDADESSLAAFTSGLPNWVQSGDDGTTIRLVPDRIAETFYYDCDQSTARRATERTLPAISIASGIQTPGVAAWRTRPSTYVVCTQDRAIDPATQQTMAQRASAIIEWDCGHTPFLSRPHAVADLLANLASPVW